MSATLEMCIDSFISNHGLEESIKDNLCELVSECFGLMFKHLLDVPVPVAAEPVKPVSKKSTVKVEKIEDISSVETQDQLRNCTSACLNEYCKENNLKVGGNKVAVMERVWKFLQGTCSDEDKSRVAKPKKVKEPIVHHTCCGVNSKNQPCATGANEKFGENFYCWRHIEFASEIEKTLRTPAAITETITEEEIVPVIEKKYKKPAAIVETVTEEEIEKVPTKIHPKKKSNKKFETELVSE
jgi:hypothetical protein